jgi:hypothetical protein
MMQYNLREYILQWGLLCNFTCPIIPTSQQNNRRNKMTNNYSELFQTFLGAGVYDGKAREIGYVVAFCDNGTDFRAYVQNARNVKHDFKEFGVRQRSKSFTSQTKANTWAYRTAKVRIEGVRKKAGFIC